MTYCAHVLETTDRRWDAAARRLPLAAVGAFAVLTVVTGVVARMVFVDVGQEGNYPYLDGPTWLDAWFHGDSGWYYAIASGGYSYTPGQQSPIAFFPAYPLLVHVVGELLHGDFSTAAGLVTLGCAAGAVWLFASWIRTRVPAWTAVVAVALLLLYPYSFFLYGSGYSDALFLLSALASFALLERRLYLLAGIVAVAATAGRPIGIAVTAGLVVRAVEMLAEERARRRTAAPVPVAAGAGSGPGLGVDPDEQSVADRPVPLRDLVGALREVRFRELSLLVSVAGLVAWTVYLGTRFGDPFAFATVQGAPGWDQGSGPFTWFKAVFVGTLLDGRWDVMVLLIPQALACLAAVLLVRTCWRRFGWGYTAFAVVSIAIPIIGTKDFMGAGRYVLAAYPLLAAGAVVLTGPRRPRWLLPLVGVALAAGLVTATVAYVQGVEVS